MGLVHVFTEGLNLGIIIKILVIADLLEIEDTFGFRQDMVRSFVEFETGVLVFNFKYVRDICDKSPNVLNLELAAYLLWRVFCLLPKALIDEFDHLFKAIFEIGLELLKCFISTSFECVA